MDYFITPSPGGGRQSNHCHELPDGVIRLKVGRVHYSIGPSRFADLQSFTDLWCEMVTKNWFSAEIAAELVNMITSRWHFEFDRRWSEIAP